MVRCQIQAGVAQLVEQLIRNQQVTRSSRVAGSRSLNHLRESSGRLCVGSSFTVGHGGPPIRKRTREIRLVRDEDRVSGSRHLAHSRAQPRRLLRGDALHALATIAQFRHGGGRTELRKLHGLYRSVRNWLTNASDAGT
jgi:hypothetical protein